MINIKTNKNIKRFFAILSCLFIAIIVFCPIMAFANPSSVKAEAEKLAVEYRQRSETAVLFCVVCVFVIIGLIIALQKVIKHRSHLVESNRLYENIFDLSGEIMFYYNFKTDEFTVTGKTASSWFKSHTMIDFGKTIKYIENDSTTMGMILFNLIQTRQSGEENFLCKQRNGFKRWVNIVYRPIYGKKSAPIFFIGKIADIHESVTEKTKLKTKAQKDQLTQLYNAGTCKSLINDFLTRKDEQVKGALIVCDVDYFKSINDSYGHQTGDDVLARIGGILNSVFRSVDVVGRVGGDEFLILLSNVTDNEIVAQKCVALLQKCKNISPDFKVTLSIGCAVFTKGFTMEQLYKIADRALYEVKKNGRNGYRIFSMVERGGISE